MPITAGTYNVGPGETLTDWAAVSAQLTGQVATGNITFIQTGNISAGVVTVAFAPIFVLNAFTLRFTSSVPHNGNILSGNKTGFSKTAGASVTGFSLTGITGTGIVQFDNFYIQSLGNDVDFFIVNLGATSITVNLYDVIFYDPFTGGSYAYSATGPGSKTNMFNVTLYTAAFRQVSIGSGSAGHVCKIENVSGLAVGAGSPTSALVIINPGVGSYLRNSFIGNSGSSRACFILTGATNLTSRNNASDDATAPGTGSILSVVPATEFVSLSPASANYLKLKSTSQFIAAGLTPLLLSNNHGSRGNARPNGAGRTSLGADEFLIAGGIFPGVSP